MVDTDPKSGRVSKFFIGFKAFEPGSKIFACSYSHLVQIIQVTSLSSFFKIFCFWIKWCSPLCPVMKQKRLNKCNFQKYLFWSFDIVIYIPKAPFILFTNFHILSKNSRLFMNCRHFLAAGLCKPSLDEFVDICTFSMFQLLKICFVLCFHNVFGQFFFLEQ